MKLVGYGSEIGGVDIQIRIAIDGKSNRADQKLFRARLNRKHPNFVLHRAILDNRGQHLTGHIYVRCRADHAVGEHLLDSLLDGIQNQEVRAFLAPLLENNTTTRRVALVSLPVKSAVEQKTELPMSVERLSARELDVLALVAEGMSNTQIARKLFISVSTVKHHIHNVLGKLGAQNRTEAVHLARSMGSLGQ